MMGHRRVWGLFAVVLALASFAASATALGAAPTAQDFTDWTAISGTPAVATGTLHEQAVSLWGTHVFPVPVSRLDGTWPAFAGPDFTPPLASTDMIQIGATIAAQSYTLSFGAPVSDPELEIGSLGSRLDFPSGTVINRISGQAGFAVSGSTITGTPTNTLGPDGVSDSNGTVQLIGTFTSISFTTSYSGSTEDGILLQVGAAPSSTTTTTTTTPTTTTPATTTTTPTTTTQPPPLPTLPSRTVDLRISGIEVTQGTQWAGCGGCTGTLPSRKPVLSLRGVIPASNASYQGVRMAAGKETVVRVFATFTRPAGLASLGGVTASLDVMDSTGRVIATFKPDGAPSSLTPTACWNCVTLEQRADPNGSFTFLVPWDETFHRQLSFRATVRPIRYAQALLPTVQCSGCHANVFTLSGVPFVPALTVPIHPIPLQIGKARNCGLSTAVGCTDQTTVQVFSDAQTVLPELLQIYGWDSPLAVDNLTNQQAAAAVAKRASDDKLTNRDYPVGVFYNGEGSLANGNTAGVMFSGGGAASIVQDKGRLLTSVTHEIGHGLGLVHADTGSNCITIASYPGHSCPGNHSDGTQDCGGNSNGQPGEAWPPDNEGRLQSVGFDRRAWDIFKTGSVPSTFVEGYTHDRANTKDDTLGARYYDFMSYCPAGGVHESLDWISVRNWDALLNFHPPTQALPPARDTRARTAQGTPVRVIATVGSDGPASIYDVAPGQQTDSGPTPGTPYHIELRNAAGSDVESVAATTTLIHTDGIGQRPGLLLTATLPFTPSAAAVVITGSGQTLATRTRSAHAPTVRLLAPRTGARLGRAGTSTVRWSAHDADGGRLTATVDYSADHGRTWKVVADAITGGSARVPNRAFSRSSNARIRVRINDGFNDGTAISGRLHAVGAPPVVQILGAHNGTRIPADSIMLLLGQALDDAGRQLTGHQLNWYAGRRLIGHGERLTVQHLPAGATRITLAATDSNDRTARTTLRIRLLAPKPMLTLVRAPAKLSAHARRLTIKVASNVPATFTIARIRHQIGSRPRSITIVVRPARTTLRFPYSLRAPGGTARGTYIVTR